MEDWWKSWLGKALGCDRDGHLTAMEHEAGIEWVDIGWDLGIDMDLGVSSGLGINSTSPLRVNPMRPLVHKDQVFKLCSLALQIFLLSLSNYHVQH